MSLHCLQETDDQDDSVIGENDAEKAMDAGDLAADDAGTADNGADDCGSTDARTCYTDSVEDAAESNGRNEKSKAHDDDDDENGDEETEAASAEEQ